MIHLYRSTNHGTGFTDEMRTEPILPLRKVCKLLWAPETPGGTLPLKDYVILVSFLNLVSG